MINTVLVIGGIFGYCVSIKNKELVSTGVLFVVVSVIYFGSVVDDGPLYGVHCCVVCAS